MIDNPKIPSAKPLLAKAVAAVASELNLSRRNWISYPPAHPVVETSLQKLLAAWRNLMQQQSPVQIGVTRDGLLLNDELVEKGNLACSTLAAVLFERGVGTLLILHEPRLEELRNLLRLITMKRDVILAGGGIEELWEAAAITFIKVRGIRYDRFSGTEEAVINISDADSGTAVSGTVWERFVRLMMQGELGLSSTDAAGNIRPEVLAAALNASFAQRTGTGSGLSSVTIRDSLDIMRELLGDKVIPVMRADNESEAPSEQVIHPVSAEQAGLLAFIAALDPTLRRHILDGFCETGTAEDGKIAEDLVRYLGPAMLQDTYANAEEYAAAPPLLQGILRKLLPHMTETYETVTPQVDIRDKIRTLLQEHDQEAYIPDEYLLGLKDLLTDNPLPHIEQSELKMLLTSLEPAAVEIRGSEIIMQLVLADPDGENTQELIRNLTELCGYFLELGDYSQVLKILRQAADPEMTPSLRMALRNAFSQADFLDEVLSGLTVWGKPKYDQVTLLIRVIGKPFIDPLLDRLADEENMSLRRFMMDRVLAFGDTARPALLARFGDRRWYVLRNIIVMLRTLAPGQEADHLRPLLKNPNLKVRYEVVKSLLLAGDPIAQRQLLRDLSSNNSETQLAAIHLADKTSGLDIARKLIELLLAGGYTAPEYEFKAACVKALGEIGRPEVLPDFAKVLKVRSLLAYKNLNRLKVDIVRSLERYPAAAVQPILERLASGSDEVAIQASKVLRNVRSKLS